MTQSRFARFAPKTARYLLAALNDALPSARRLVFEAPLSAADGGEGGDYTVSIADASGSTKGAVKLAGQIGGTATAPDVRGIRVNPAGTPVLLTVGAVGDGQCLMRSGTALVGGSPSSLATGFNHIPAAAVPAGDVSLTALQTVNSASLAVGSTSRVRQFSGLGNNTGNYYPSVWDIGSFSGGFLAARMAWVMGDDGAYPRLGVGFRNGNHTVVMGLGSSQTLIHDERTDVSSAGGQSNSLLVYRGAFNGWRWIGVGWSSGGSDNGPDGAAIPAGHLVLFTSVCGDVWSRRDFGTLSFSPTTTIVALDTQAGAAGVPYAGAIDHFLGTGLP